MNSTRSHDNTFSMGHFFNTISKRGRTHIDLQTHNHASPPFEMICESNVGGIVKTAVLGSGVERNG